VYIGFRTRRLERCYRERREREKAWGKIIARKYVQAVDLLKAVDHPSHLGAFPQFDYEPLTQDRIGPWPDVAIPPGELLAEALRSKGLSQTELAKRTGRPIQAVNEIIKGKKAITPETAMELERVLGTPAYIWLNLERDYRYNRARLEDLRRLDAQVEEARAYPYAEMAKLGWVAATRDPIERVRELLKYFGVASLSTVPKVHAVAYRKSQKRDASPEALAAWLRKGEIDAAEVKTKPFDARKLKASVARIRQMTQLPPEEFQQALCDLCAECGVALVFVPHLPRTHANGAVRWLDKDKALVQLSVLHRYDDIFWFSLFHELAHPLLHGKREVFVERPDGRKDEKEQEADQFAADILIPPDAFERVRMLEPYSRARVQAFAREIGVTASIVVGRLHHEGLLPHTHLNGLRTKLAITEC
jgi:HTH-type transcriptional regulator/antitoxin HigA